MQFDLIFNLNCETNILLFWQLCYFVSSLFLFLTLAFIHVYTHIYIHTNTHNYMRNIEKSFFVQVRFRLPIYN